MKPDGRVRRVFAILGTAVFLLLAPGIVAGLVPWWISGWRIHPAFLGFIPFRVIGTLLIAFGITILLESFGRFAFQGIGTPAPVFPTRHLVVKGFYRYVRNPMYLAVVSLILGQSLLLGDIHLVAYATLVWLVMHLFVLTYEEPTMRKSFGTEYETFCAHVPRWIPRFTFTPWHEGTGEGPGHPQIVGLFVLALTNSRKWLVGNALSVRFSLHRDGLLLARLWFCSRFFGSFSFVSSDSKSLDLQSLIHIEALFSVQTLHEFARGLSNRTANTGCIDLNSAPFRACFSVFIFQGDVIGIQNHLHATSLVAGWFIRSISYGNSFFS